MVENIEILVGMDHYFKFVRGQTRHKGVNLLKTAGGLIIAGSIPQKFRTNVDEVSQNITLVARVHISPITSEEIESLHQAKTMWDLENIGITPETNTPEEEWVLDEFKQTVQYKNQQYWVKLPWR